MKIMTLNVFLSRISYGAACILVISLVCFSQQKLIRKMVPEPITETQKVNPQTELAYVHVKSQVPNLRFDSNRKIDKVVQTSSGDWDLWLPGGTHILKISADGYQTLELAPYTYGKKKSFELILKVRAIYSIMTDPIGALVKIDDQDSVTAPGQIELEVGPHKVEISKMNYESLTYNINLTEDALSEEKKLVLLKAVFSLRTDPSDATVAVDGHTIGNSPIETMLPLGEHQILITNTNCQEMSWTINLEKKGYSERRKLIKLVGIYRIISTPPSATVKIDGMEQGKTPMDIQLNIGRHSVDIDLQHYDELSYNIDLTENGLSDKKELVHYYPHETGLGIGGAMVLEKNMFKDSIGGTPSTKGGMFISLFYRYHFTSHLSAGVRMAGYILTLSNQKYLQDGVEKRDQLSFSPFNLSAEGRWTFFREKFEPYCFLFAGYVNGDLTTNNSSDAISSATGVSFGGGVGATFSISKQFTMSVEATTSFGSATWDKSANPYSSDLNYNPSYFSADLVFSYRWGGD